MKRSNPLLKTKLKIKTKAKNCIPEARGILSGNDVDHSWTLPTSINLYPHQWLWDGFFIAIGLRHYDIERAKNEVRSPFRAQWKNGMVPHIIFSDTPVPRFGAAAR